MQRVSLHSVNCFMNAFLFSLCYWLYPHFCVSCTYSLFVYLSIYVSDWCTYSVSSIEVGSGTLLKSSSCVILLTS